MEIAVLELGNDMKWENIERDTGYKPITNFYETLTEAEKQGLDNVIDVFNQIFAEEREKCKKGDYKRMTELSLVTNWKMWDWHDKGKDLIGRIYEKFWRKVGKFCLDNFKGEALTYYLHTTD